MIHSSLSVTSPSGQFFPKAGNPSLGAQRLADFLQVCSDQQVTDIKALINKNQQNHDLLCAIFANSPYLSRLLSKDPAFAARLLAAEPADLFQNILTELEQKVPQITDTALISKTLRQAKAKVALITSFTDMAGVWSLNQVTRALTEFAELSVKLAVSHLLRVEMVKGNLALPPHLRDTPTDKLLASPDLARDTGYVVLAMGKMGGFELNYSSDIDLIVLFDNDIVDYTGRKTAQDLFIRLTRNLMKMMQERTADGYVFRTDLRLRPDPGATAIALSMEGAEIYYQSMGLNWERAAMIKARPVAGDLAAGDAFLDRIKSFVWRRHLDYVALEDIYAIKKLIHQHHGHKQIGFAGQDVKLGHGGIREIEFYAQIFQLIAGGREPELRIPATCDALNALVKNNKISPEDNEKLQSAYVYYRTLEHRLQMINDDQTHSLPDTPEELDRVTRFMGYDDQKTFADDLQQHLHTVHDLFTDLLKESHQEEDQPDELLAFPPDIYNKTTIEVIKKAGFDDPQPIYDIMQKWLLGRYRSCRTERARGLLHTLIPDILFHFGKQTNRDVSFLKFDEFISRLPSGVQLFSFIKAQPWLLELLAEIIGMAPYLSDQLAKRPLLLDAVLNQGFFNENHAAADLINHLEGQLVIAKDFQDTLDITRKWANEQKFQCGVQILRNNITAQQAGHILSRVADVILRVMFERVRKEFIRKHGQLKQVSFAILALGKLGGRELTTTSDLDLVFIYDSPVGNHMSDGSKPLSVNHYFARLSQQFINALTAMTGEGRLYEVDMRLRPSGNAGPIAVSLEGFEEYQTSQAWTWEHLALTRGRVIIGGQGLKDKINHIIANVLASDSRSPDDTLLHTADMREKLRAEFGTSNVWSVKHTRGGLVDIEFICQYLILRHGHACPDLITPNTLDQIDRLQRHGFIHQKEAEILQEACTFMQNLQVILRLCLGNATKPATMPQGLIDMLCDRFGLSTIDDLENTVRQMQVDVSRIFKELIEVPAKKIIVAQKETTASEGK